MCENLGPLTGICQETTLLKFPSLVVLVGVLAPVSLVMRARVTLSISGKNVTRSKWFSELKRGHIHCLTQMFNMYVLEIQLIVNNNLSSQNNENIFEFYYNAIFSDIKLF